MFPSWTADRVQSSAGYARAAIGVHCHAPGTTPPPTPTARHLRCSSMDRSGSANNGSEFGGGGVVGAATMTGRANTAPWSNDKESPNNEDDSNEDDGDNASPAKVTDPLAPRLANNEVSCVESRELFTKKCVESEIISISFLICK